MAATQAQMRAVKKYQENNYEYYKLRFNKGDREKVQEMAKAEGKSVNQFILDRIFGKEE